MSEYLELNNKTKMKINGFYDLESDKLAVKKFQKHIDDNFYPDEAIEYYNQDIINLYTKQEIDSLYKYAYSIPFEWESFMGISKFYADYALKSPDKKKYLETFQDRCVAVALDLADGDIGFAKDILNILISRQYTPATPTIVNCLKKQGGQRTSCFLLYADDTLNSINYTLSSAAQLSKEGGGVSISLSRLRSRGEPIRGVDNASKGIMPVVKLFEDLFNYADQSGQRAGAGAVYLNIFHADLLEFLDSKKINASEKDRIQNLSLGLIIPDKFMELAKENNPFYTFKPYSVYKEYGVHLDDMNINEMYGELMRNPNVQKVKMPSAREILTKIAMLQLESGYPYIMFKDNANKVHALKKIGEIKQSNLCVTGDTRLLTDRGYIKAKELYEEQTIFKAGIDSRTKNMDLKNFGCDIVKTIPMQRTARSVDVYKMRLSNGMTIKSTKWHKYYIAKDEKVVKKPLSELIVGDKVLIQSDCGFFGNFGIAETRGLAHKGKNNILKVPEFIFKGTKETVCTYLSNVFKTEGSISTSKKYKSCAIQLISASEQFLQEIQMLLINLGVFATVYKQHSTKKNYKLLVQDRNSIDNFIKNIKLEEKDIEKLNKCKKMLTNKLPKHQYTSKIVSIEYVGKEDVYDTTQTDYHSLIFNGIVTGNCTEIMQLQEVSTINDYFTDDIIKRDISCNLGSLNIVNLMEKGDIGETVETAVRMLSKVSDKTLIKEVPSVLKANQELHSIGLGAMNLHGYFAKNNIMYGSDESVEFVRAFFSAVCYYSIKTSMLIAKDRNEVFVDFDKSEYYNGNFFEQYLNEDFSPKSDKIVQLFKYQKLPTIEDWKQLKEDVHKYGMYNAYRMAIAPNGSISYIMNSTASIMPINDIIETRTYANSTTYYPMPYLSKETERYYMKSCDINQYNYLNLVSEIQKHVDQGISTTLQVYNDIKMKDLARLYIYAHAKGLKGLYYTRPNNKTLEMQREHNICESCSV